MSRRRPAARGDPQAGMVTAETVAAFPALVLVLVMAVWAVTVAAGQLRCSDAAREAARAVARGEDLAVVRDVATEVAPPGADIVIDEVGGTVEVRVSARMTMPGGLGDTLPARTVSARAVALAEAG